MAFILTPEKTAQLIRSNTEISEDVARIIHEHHEKPDGTGFPQQLSHKNIHPLSAIFIVLHDFVEQLYLTHFNPELMVPILEDLTKKYNQGNYETALMALLKTFNVNKKFGANSSDPIPSDIFSDEEAGNMDPMAS